MDYIVFDTSALDEMFQTIWANTGNVVSIAIYLFLLCLSVFAVIKLVKYFVLGDE